MAGRRRYCDSYNVFVHNADRAQAFLRVFDASKDRGATSTDERQLLRGTVVFMVGALDAFLHDLVLELVPMRAAVSEQLGDALKEIVRADPLLPVRMVRAASLDEGRAILEGALDTWSSNKSFQWPWGVRRALGIIGCDIPWADFDTNFGGDTAARLEFFIGMRNDVIHRGTSPRIQRTLAQECVDLTRSIASVINREAVKLYGPSNEQPRGDRGITPSPDWTRACRELVAGGPQAVPSTTSRRRAGPTGIDCFSVS